MRLLLVSLATHMACGDVSTVEPGDGTSPDATDAIPTDAGVQSRCDPTADFGKPVGLDALNGVATPDESAFLTEDELTIYFSTRREMDLNDWNIYTATRKSVDERFRDPVKLDGVNTTGFQRRPTVSGDGRILYATTRANGDDISFAEWDDTAGHFGPLKTLQVLDPAADTGSPYMLSNGRIYFDSNDDPENPESLESIIYSMTRTDTGTEVPTVVEGIDIGRDEFDDMHPVLTPDELTMYYASTRNSNVDIWVTRRSAADEPFGESSLVERLNTTNNDFPDWISPDGCVLYFTRENVSSSLMSYDILMATRGAGEDAM